MPLLSLASFCQIRAVLLSVHLYHPHWTMIATDSYAVSWTRTSQNYKEQKIKLSSKKCLKIEEAEPHHPILTDLVLAAHQSKNSILDHSAHIQRCPWLRSPQHLRTGLPKQSYTVPQIFHPAKPTSTPNREPKHTVKLFSPVPQTFAKVSNSLPRALRSQTNPEEKQHEAYLFKKWYM